MDALRELPQTAFLFAGFMGTPVWFWLFFLGIVVILLVLDLGILNRDHHEIDVANSLCLSAFYMFIAFCFGAWIWWESGSGRAMEYYTGYLVEISLSMDNLFVMALVFSYFGIPRSHQHDVLFWGILGVIVFRAIMIGLGAVLIHRFEWILYVFGAFLVFTGIKMLLAKGDEKPDLENNRAIRFLRRHLRVTTDLHGHRFFVRIAPSGQAWPVLYATPLFLALIVIEVADLVFAVDSVPAVFSVTTDTFVVYTSNVFAVLGLRSLYFALAALLHRFIYLQVALAVVLVFIGSKVFLANLVGKIPPAFSLSITVAILAAGILVSLMKTKGPAQG
ncbi:MAG: TerC family protein [Moraxellaceae bacterium]